jgi:hypothetical protein
MTKTTHTHRGTCQSCGSVQASANSNSLIAKHGYTVNWGYFNGTCQGSGHRPAEHDVTLTNRVIKFCNETAALHDAAVTCLKDGSSVPNTFERYNPTKVVEHTSRSGHKYTTKGGNDVLPIAQATPAERAKAIALAIHDEEMHASGLRSHASGLTRYVLPRLGQPLYLVSDLNKPVVKAPPPVVDVAKAEVVGTFKTKAARKDALDRLSRQYDKCRDTIQKAYLALPEGQRTEAKTEVYYGPYQLNHWRPKHSMLVLNEFPSLAETVTQIEALVKAREAVKAAP